MQLPTRYLGKFFLTFHEKKLNPKQETISENQNLHMGSVCM